MSIQIIFNFEIGLFFSSLYMLDINTLMGLIVCKIFFLFGKLFVSFAMQKQFSLI
jgi:hypothetical protein